jgi:hypothetical protein
MRAVREEAKQARAEARAARERLTAVEAQATQQANYAAAQRLALSKALGVATEEPPDPEQLAKHLAAAREQTQAEVTKAPQRERELTVELELLKQARRHGADPELLVDSRSFMRTLGKLDPASDYFATDLGDAIKDAVERKPRVQAGRHDTAGRRPCRRQFRHLQRITGQQQ